MYEAYDSKLIDAIDKDDRFVSSASATTTSRKPNLAFLVDELKSRSLSNLKINIKCKNERQKQFLSSIDKNEITICIGDSGVGKSYLSIAKSLDLLKEGKFQKIFIITPIVEIEESIGYLKGSLDEKLGPYLYSVYYLIDKIVGEDMRKKLVENKIIEPLCVSYMRGINIDNSIACLDEAQNFSKKALLTILTRIGYNSKFIISGDLSQIDKFKNANDSGLNYIYHNLRDLDGIGLVEFNKEDIVRNPIISKILNRF